MVNLNAQDTTHYAPVSFIRLTSQNDLYQAYLKSDKHFTNGAHIQVSHKKFDIPLFKRILPGNFLDGNENYIISIGQDMYTPEDFERTTVDSTDRPYAGVLYATFNRTISSPAKLRIFRSSLILGVIGPASGAAKTQNFLHRILDNDIFQGWDHQIGNGLILDYAMMYRKGINGLPSFLDVSGSVNANVGTMLNYASLSSRFIIGKFNNPY
ncbi:MAG: lipid A-modifier LpxR family protein [Bacteroidales bacterium]